MNLLLDTHALLWWLAGDKGLSTESAAVIGDPDNVVVVSAATFWEIAIKVKLGKLRIDVPISPLVSAQGLKSLDITPAHAETAGALPLHHRDPFDRMLIAQAQTEDLTVMTRDRAFSAYGVATAAC